MEPTVYGLDIETDTDTDGLDPAVSAVLAVAVSTAQRDIVLEGPEATLLGDLDALLAGLAPGVIATWNGGRFDLPFLATRAALHHLEIGLSITHDPTVAGYRAVWGAHRHLDAYRLYRADVGPALGLSCSLKAIARFAGLDPVEVDASRVHELPAGELARYVASDARCTRALALRRGVACLSAVDPTPAGTPRSALPTLVSA